MVYICVFVLLLWVEFWLVDLGFIDGLDLECFARGDLVWAFCSSSLSSLLLGLVGFAWVWLSACGLVCCLISGVSLGLRWASLCVCFIVSWVLVSLLGEVVLIGFGIVCGVGALNAYSFGLLIALLFI